MFVGCHTDMTVSFDHVQEEELRKSMLMVFANKQVRVHTQEPVIAGQKFTCEVVGPVGLEYI
jgi:hypothetical protein